MKAVTLTPAFRCAALLAALLPSAFAQNAPASSPAVEPVDRKDDVVVLSPFVVSSETENGYQATETLAGMRVRTNLKDTGAAVDVLTDSFLNDVGAVDLLDSLKYVANMQYAAFPGTQDATNASQWFSTPYLSRGVPGATILVDFFRTGAVPVDRYNTENMTMMRGPNAILFGIGSPSGIVGASTKRALLNRNVNTVRFMTDTNSSMRTELDSSRVLIPDKLALRIAAVFSDKKTDQDPSLNRRNAVFATATYKPFSKTTITANAENGINYRLFVQNHIVQDGYTPWVAAGKPIVTSRVGFPEYGAAYSTSVASGLQSMSTGSYLVQIQGSNLPIMDWRGMARGALWSNTMGTGLPGSGLMLAADRSQMDNISFNESNAIVPLNRNIFLDGNRIDLNYQSKSVFVEQNIVRNLDLELAWNEFTSDYIFFTKGYSSQARILVDANAFLPDRTPNPYAGMPYVETGNNGSSSSRETGSLEQYRNRRATLSYALDLDKKKIFRNIGFGDYRFAAMAEEDAYTQRLISTRWVNVTPVPGNATANPLNVVNNRISERYYLTPGEDGFRLVDPILISQPNLPGAPAANNGPVKIEKRMSDETPRNNREDTRSLVAVVQGSWWMSKDNSYAHLTGMYGWREDRLKKNSEVFTRLASGEYALPVVPDRAYELLDQYGTPGVPTTVTAHTKSYNATFRPISALRLFYNFSDIFRTSPASFTDVRGVALRPAFGETQDYGIKVDLLKERVFVTLTRYETSVVDTGQDNTGTVREPLQQIYSAIQANGAPSAADSAIATRELDIMQRPWSYRDDTTKGYEAGITANITQNWNLRLTYGTQKTIVSATFNDWVPYFADYKPFWQKYATTTLVTTSAGYTTVADAIARADQRLIDARALIGQQPTDQRSRNSTLQTSYRFSEGRLKGFRVGGGYRWASANVLGYARDSAGNLDRTKPFDGPEEFSVDFNMGYSRKIWKGKYTWDIQLNVYNALNDDGIKPRQAVDDGKGGRIVVRSYLAEPRAIQLTNTIKF